MNHHHPLLAALYLAMTASVSTDSNDGIEDKIDHQKKRHNDPEVAAKYRAERLAKKAARFKKGIEE